MSCTNEGHKVRIIERANDSASDSERYARYPQEPISPVRDVFAIVFFVAKLLRHEKCCSFVAVRIKTHKNCQKFNQFLIANTQKIAARDFLFKNWAKIQKLYFYKKVCKIAKYQDILLHLLPFSGLVNRDTFP